MGKAAFIEQVAVVFTILTFTILVIITQWKVFSISYSIPEYEHMYGESQYVKGDNKTIELGDGDIYTFAGIRYAQGEDVTKINFEHPPLMKYLFGVSYLLFGKPNWILVPMIIIGLYLFWKLSFYVLATAWFRVVALGLLMFHSAWNHSVVQTMLDFPLCFFLLLTLFIYVKAVEKMKMRWWISLGISAGLLLSIKYPIPLSVLFLMLVYGFGGIKIKKIKPLLMSGFIALGTYVFTYASFFIHHHSLIDFFKFEWWRWQWFQGKTDSQKFMLLQTLFLGKYPRWWDKNGGYITIGHWSVLWPLEFILYCISWVIRPKNDILFPYKIWIILSFAIYMIGAAEDRFLVPLVPGFALYSAVVLEHLYNTIRMKAA